MTPAHAADECLQQEVGESVGCVLPALRLLQLLPDSQDAPRDACDGSRDHHQHLDASRLARLGIQSTINHRFQRGSFLAHFEPSKWNQCTRSWLTSTSKFRNENAVETCSSSNRSGQDSLPDAVSKA
jgi:hypothetical protein